MRALWILVACGLAGASGASAQVRSAAPMATCGPSALPGLGAARMRLRPPSAEPATVVLTALRAASVDEFLLVAAAITGRDATDPVIDELARAPLAALPCSPPVLARDRVAYSLLLGGYSAREIADIVSGRLSKREIDDAQRLLMTGQPEAAAAAFLDRAMTERQRRHEDAQRRAARPQASRRAGPTAGRPPGGPVASRQSASAIQSAIARFAHQFQVEPALVHAMIAAESDGDAAAVSPKGAIGLMQLMPATARMLGVDPADPIDNLRGGIAYLAGLVQQFGNTRDALIAYNAGPSHAERVRKGLAVLYGETRRYLDAIARRYPL